MVTGGAKWNNIFFLRKAEHLNNNFDSFAFACSCLIWKICRTRGANVYKQIRQKAKHIHAVLCVFIDIIFHFPKWTNKIRWMDGRWRRKKYIILFKQRKSYSWACRHREREQDQQKKWNICFKNECLSNGKETSCGFRFYLLKVIEKKW